MTEGLSDTLARLFAEAKGAEASVAALAAPGAETSGGPGGAPLSLSITQVEIELPAYISLEGANLTPRLASPSAIALFEALPLVGRVRVTLTPIEGT